MTLLASFVVALLAVAQTPPAKTDWRTSPIWYDGMVEKATYQASRPIYGRDRTYTAIFFTNKEQHDTKTWTKAAASASTREVFKHNQIDDIPTPNYTYHFRTTSHLTTDTLELTRMESSSQEFCGTSFKQITRSGKDDVFSYWAFSYMPQAGHAEAQLSGKIIPYNALPLYLRNFDFSQPVGTEVKLSLLPDQKSHKSTPAQVALATIKYAGVEDGSHKLTVTTDNKLLGTFYFATDRLHVMTRYQGADGQQYQLISVERNNYWSITSE
jgi:hypothetical protein